MKKRSLLTLLSGIMLISAGFVSCSEDEGGGDTTNTLKVAPDSPIAFAASGNANVVLTVTTDAESWDFTKPDWVTATQNGDKLTVNVKDNTTGTTLAGRIQVSAGNADPVYINISQAKAGDDPDPDPTKVAASLMEDSGERNRNFQMEDADVEGKMYIELAKAAGETAEFKLSVDAAYLDEYNFINGTVCQLYPAALIKLSDSAPAIAAGSTVSDDITVTLEFDNSQIAYGVDYLVPIYAEPKSSNVKISDAVSRVNYIVRRKSQKAVRNILYFEVNDVNPLNALEYKIQGGEYFFDAVILFSANINWNPDEGRVYLSNNPNVQALLDGTETYLQPLRQKGIKVYLGLLGNHDIAGLAQLTDYGAKMYAQEVAEAIKYYKLDGICLDDEYSSTPVANEWIGSRSGAAASRFAYEAKKAMREVCGENKDVVTFEWGMYYSSNMIAVEGNSPHTFIDIVTANYGGTGSPVSGGTKAMCSYMSVELALGRGTTTTAAGQAAVSGGYGWYMWFALNPVPGHDTSNYPECNTKIDAVCKGLYEGKGLITPTHYYKKIGSGVYDPVRYAY